MISEQSQFRCEYQVGDSYQRLEQLGLDTKMLLIESRKFRVFLSAREFDQQHRGYRPLSASDGSLNEKIWIGDDGRPPQVAWRINVTILT
jgi:hypothetical protein